ncbi:MAG TPA: hypothetical protein VHZ24_15100 [Pirellulales bacterium]|jgi:hypothetical protein|nr:hypothetical protein [Pirellulales bacterium]
MWWTACLLTAVLAASPVRFAESDAFEGEVTSVEDGSITVLGKSGDSVEFDVPLDAKITLNGKKAKLTDIEIGDFAKVTAKGSGEKRTATAIEARDSE